MARVVPSSRSGSYFSRNRSPRELKNRPPLLVNGGKPGHGDGLTSGRRDQRELQELEVGQRGADVEGRDVGVARGEEVGAGVFLDADGAARGQHHGPGAVRMVFAGLHVDAECAGDPSVLPQELRDHGPLAHLDFAVEDLLAERAQHSHAAAHRRTTARVGAAEALFLVELLAVGGLLEVQAYLLQLDDPVSDLVDDGPDDLLVGDEVAPDDGVLEVHLLAVAGVGVAEGRLRDPA